MKSYDTYIAGRWRAAKGGRQITSINPYTGATWASVPHCCADDVDEAVNAAHTAYRNGPWRSMGAAGRARIMQHLATLIERDAEELARVETTDNGKLLAETRAQIAYSAQWWRYYAGLADKIEGTVPALDKPGYFAYTQREPCGVVAIITPWNSPLLLATFKLAPALAAGCTVVWKPSEHTSVSSLVYGRLLEEAGFPAGVVNIVTGLGADTGAALVSHPKIAKIALTGGESTARMVGRSAADNIVPTLLELGGKSANIVFQDADLDQAVQGVAAGILAASGQTCIAGSRLLVERSIYDTFLVKLKALFDSARLGDPMKPETQIGPLTTPAQHAHVLRAIEQAKSDGCDIISGGCSAIVPGSESGLFIQPTLIGNAGNELPIAREEVFGPVLCVMPFDDEEHAFSIADDSSYGLAAGIWSRDIAKCMRLANRLEVGTVWVNTYRALSYMMPFGGRRRSGHGRENGIRALEEFLETKSVWLSTEVSVGNPYTLR